MSEQRPATGRRAPAVGIPVILGVALVARVALIAVTHHLPLGSDPTDYDRLARLLAHGHGWGQGLLAAGRGPTAFRAPLYPLFLSGIYRVTGDSITAARLAQALLGVASVALLAWIAARLLGQRVAVVAAALAAVYPPLLVYSTAILSESIFIPLELAAVAAALRARDDHRQAMRWSLIAGVLVGLGVLARPNSVVLLLPLGALVAGRASWRTLRAWAKPALLVAGAIAVVSPWLLRNEMVMHSLVPVTDIDAFNLAGVYNADSGNAPYPYRYQFRPPNAVASMAPLFTDARLNEVALADKLRARGLTYLRHHPQAVPEAVFWNTFRMADLGGHNEWRITMTEAGYGNRLADLSLLSWFGLALLAAAGTLTKGARRLPVGVVGVPVLLWLGSVPFLGTERLRVPIEPFLILLAAAAVVASFERPGDTFDPVPCAGARTPSAQGGQRPT